MYGKKDKDVGNNYPVLMLENIRKNPALRDMPVIMVTAEAGRDIVSDVAESEIDGYLLKPLTLDALYKRIKAVIDQVHSPEPFTLHRNKDRSLRRKGCLMKRSKR